LRSESLRALEGLTRVSNGFDMLEVRFGAAAEFLLVERTFVRAAGCHERVSCPGEPRENRVGVLVAQDRDAEDVLLLGEPGQQPLGRLGRVRAVEDESVAPFQPAREVDVDLGGDGASEVGLGRLAGAAVADLSLRDEVGERVVR
jgi:hypothetical protein